MPVNTETATRLASGFSTMRADDGSDRVIITDGPDADTLRAMVFAADSAGLSWDDAYTMTRDALQQIADTDPDEISETSRDGLIEIYNAPLMHWLSRNWQLADEMKNEYGEWPESITDIAQATQDYAYGLVLGAIESNWPEAASEEDDEN